MSGVIIAMLKTAPGSTPALSNSAAPTFISGYSSGFGTCTSSEPAVASVSGGSPPYTYLWSRVSGDTDITIQDPTNYYTYFTALLSSGDSVSTVFKCTVTDAASTVVDTNTITVTLVSLVFDFGGGGGIIIP